MDGTPNIARQKAIDEAIRYMRLSDQQEKILVLRFENMLTQWEIADTLGISVYKVSAFLTRFIKMLFGVPCIIGLTSGIDVVERYTYFVQQLFNKKKNEETMLGYSCCDEDIDIVPVCYLALIGASPFFLSELFSSGIVVIQDLKNEVTENTELWQSLCDANRSDSKKLLTILREYHFAALPE